MNRINHRCARLLLVSCLALATAAAGAQPSAASAPASAASAAAPSRADLDFLRDAAQAGQMELDGSRVALGKAVNTQVRGYAQQMVDDHARTAQELAALAASKGVSLPSEPSPLQRAKIQLMSSSDGSSFDRRYANTLGVIAHQDTIRLYEKIVSEGEDDDIKAFAARTLPTLRQHLQMAIELNDVAKKQGNVRAPGDRKQ